MTADQKARYTAILEAQIAALNAAQSDFREGAFNQKLNLQSFKSAQDAALTTLINNFDGTAEQIALLQNGKTQFDAAMDARVDDMALFQSESDHAVNDEAERLQDIIDAL